MGKIRTLLLLLSLTLLAASVSAATAAAETEPANNRFTGADGPLANNATVKAALSAVGDEDWYYFYVGATGDFTVTSTAYTVLYEYDGGSLDWIWYMQNGGTSTPRQLEPGLYYLRIYKDSPPMSYTLKVSGPVSAQPPSVDETHRLATTMTEIYEDEDTGYKVAQLLTPYAESLAAIGADGDYDWYKFYVTRTGDVSVGQWAPKGASLCLYRDPTQRELVWFNADEGSTTTRQLTRGIYYIKMYGWRPPQEYTIVVQGDYVSLNAPSTLTTPKVVGAARSGKRTTFTGVLRPGRSAKVQMDVQRLVRGKYVAYRTAAITSAKGGQWTFAIKLRTGTYRIRAKTAASPGYTSGSSSWRKLTVRP